MARKGQRIPAGGRPSLSASEMSIMATLVTLQRTPLSWGHPRDLGVAVLRLANLGSAVVGVADGGLLRSRRTVGGRRPGTPGLLVP